jgi:alkanesulfonate monooxygenase SsuD/methylene tetrahydromethanopterin reductase-like flavin-dependent oxidoreductase (luciferase family)
LSMKYLRITYSMILIFIYNSHFRQLKTLAFATAKTNQIALGTRVIEMLFHGPVMLARRFTTLVIWTIQHS